MSSLVALGTLLSGDNPAVRSQLELFESDIDEYELVHRSVLGERGIAESQLGELAVRNAVVLIDALGPAGSLVYADGGTAADDTLTQLNDASGGLLAAIPGYGNLQVRYEELAIGNIIDGEQVERQSLRDLVRSAGFEIEVVEEDSDSYPLVLVPLDRLDEARDLAADAGVGFYLQQFYPGDS